MYQNVEGCNSYYICSFSAFEVFTDPENKDDTYTEHKTEPWWSGENPQWDVVLDKGGTKILSWQSDPSKKKEATTFFFLSQSMVPLENKPVQFNSLEAKLIKGKGGIRGGLLISQINWHHSGARTDRGGCFNGLDCSLEHLFRQSKVGGATIYNAFIIVVLQRQVKTS